MEAEWSFTIIDICSFYVDIQNGLLCTAFLFSYAFTKIVLNFIFWIFYILCSGWVCCPNWWSWRSCWGFYWSKYRENQDNTIRNYGEWRKGTCLWINFRGNLHLLITLGACYIFAHLHLYNVLASRCWSELSLCESENCNKEATFELRKKNVSTLCINRKLHYKRKYKYRKKRQLRYHP